MISEFPKLKHIQLMINIVIFMDLYSQMMRRKNNLEVLEKVKA